MGGRIRRSGARRSTSSMRRRASFWCWLESEEEPWPPWSTCSGVRRGRCLTEHEGGRRLRERRLPSEPLQLLGEVRRPAKHLDDPEGAPVVQPPVLETLRDRHAVIARLRGAIRERVDEVGTSTWSKGGCHHCPEPVEPVGGNMAQPEGEEHRVEAGRRRPLEEVGNLVPGQRETCGAQAPAVDVDRLG